MSCVIVSQYCEMYEMKTPHWSRDKWIEGWVPCTSNFSPASEIWCWLTRKKGILSLSLGRAEGKLIISGPARIEQIITRLKCINAFCHQIFALLNRRCINKKCYAMIMSIHLKHSRWRWLWRWWTKGNLKLNLDNLSQWNWRTAIQKGTCQPA